MLSPLIMESFKKNSGCNIYLYPSNKPSSYGVVEFNKKNEIKKILKNLKKDIKKYLLKKITRK